MLTMGVLVCLVALASIHSFTRITLHAWYMIKSSCCCTVSRWRKTLNQTNAKRSSNGCIRRRTKLNKNVCTYHPPPLYTSKGETEVLITTAQESAISREALLGQVGSAGSVRERRCHLCCSNPERNQRYVKTVSACLHVFCALLASPSPPAALHSCVQWKGAACSSQSDTGSPQYQVTSSSRSSNDGNCPPAIRFVDDFVASSSSSFQ